ncbi:hypothetical protein A2U01_0098256, partial [Trifolium medium]|nr:hypothetical protein [Trifolium medium]
MGFSPAHELESKVITPMSRSNDLGAPVRGIRGWPNKATSSSTSAQDVVSSATPAHHDS